MLDVASIALAGGTQVARVLADTYIKPKLEGLYNYSKTERELELIEYSFREYIERCYNIYLYMNTIVFKNQQKTIDDLYIPLTVTKTKAISDKREVEIRIDKYKDGFIPYYKKILLVDNAGMGKSTIIKFLYLRAINEKKGIPVLIELRKLERGIPIVDFIMDEVNGIKKCFNRENILELIERGDFIFFLDGYDEITEENKKQVTEDIQEFISKTSNNNFIISSREEGELSCFGDFQRFDIRPLKQEEAYELIKKYDQYGELSEELIEKLRTQENLRIINEFLENPLMVSLLYKAFEYKKTIPYKKHIFYRQVYDALFEDHDRSKGGAYVHPKKSKLDIEDFHRVLRTIGFMTLSRGIIYSKEEFINIVSKAKQKNIGINFNESNFVDDVTQAVPIFIKDGIKYRWSHKSFQEYFAASYICTDAKEKQEELLTIISSKEKIYRYYNVLDFCYDMDYKQFIRTILNPIIDKLDKFYTTNYNDKYYNCFDSKDIELRKQLQFIFSEIAIRKLGKKENKECTEIEMNSGDVFEYFFEFWKDNKIPASITNNTIGIGYFDGTIDKILNLLYNKGSNLVKKAHILPRTDIDTILIRKLNIGTYRVNDCVEEKINKKNMFNLINEYIISNNIGGNKKEFQLIFDYNKCLELKRKIEKEIEEEQNDMIFL